MTNTERRDAGLPYIADEEVYAQYRRCRALLDRLNRFSANRRTRR